MTKLIVEIEYKDKLAQFELDEPSLEKVTQAARRHAEKEELFIFEKDKDDELHNIEGRGAISIVAHHCKHVNVHVNFEHRTETETFSPSATVFKVLRWAIGKKAFNLDDTARAKANLILPDTESPLPRDEAIGKYVSDSNCSLTLELTLKDFTNGCG
jgi:hypothetical protein